MLYLVKRLTVIVAIAVLIMLATFMGYDYANIYVTVNEGIAQRAQVILQEGDYTTLGKFYTQEYLEKDSLLSNNPYKSYIVTDYDLRVKVKQIWVWPWNDEAKVTIEEMIKDIKAVPKDDGEENLSVSEWESGEKLIIMKKNGRWRIDDVILKKTIDINNEDT